MSPVSLATLSRDSKHDTDWLLIFPGLFPTHLTGLSGVCLRQWLFLPDTLARPSIRDWRLIRSCLLRSSWSSKLAFSKSCKSTDLLLILTIYNPEVFRNPCPVSSSPELPLTNERLMWPFSANQKPGKWSLFAVIHLQRLMSGLICPGGRAELHISNQFLRVKF